MSTDAICPSRQTAIATARFVLGIPSTSAMTDCGPISGMTTPTDSYLSIPDAPATPTSLNECAWLPNPTGNGKPLAISLNHPDQCPDASNVLSPRSPKWSMPSLLSTVLDAPAKPATIPTGTNQGPARTLSSSPPPLKRARALNKLPTTFLDNLSSTAAESLRMQEFCQAGETRQNLPLSSGTAAPLAPEKAELLMRRLMGKENLEPTSNQQSTSGGMDTMEYPL